MLLGSSSKTRTVFMVPSQVEPSYRPELSDSPGVANRSRDQVQVAKRFSTFLVRPGPSSRRAILLPRVAGVGAKISSDAVNRMPGAHLIFTSNRRDSFGRWLVVLAHTLPDRGNKTHVCCQFLRMEPCWRLL